MEQTDRQCGTAVAGSDVSPRAALKALPGRHRPLCKPCSLFHFPQQGSTLSDLVMEAAFFATPIYQEITQINEFSRMPDQSTIRRTQDRLQRCKLAEQILIIVNEQSSAACCSEGRQDRVSP
jgi:hypothetical protein